MEGELTEVVETSCGKEVIAVDNTIFELSGVDFGDRELGVVNMSTVVYSECPGGEDGDNCYRFGRPGCGMRPRRNVFFLP